MSNKVKIAPNAVDSEVALLGALLIAPETLSEVKSLLSPEDFFEVRHEWIYEAICDLAKRGQPIDAITVAEELRHADRYEEVGGSRYLMELANSTPTYLYAAAYATNIKNAAIRRRLLDTAGQIADLARSEKIEIEDCLGRSSAALSEVVTTALAGRVVRGAGVAEKALAQFQAWLDDPQAVRGLPTGFAKLDRILGGFERGALIAVAAVTNMGKSTFCRHLLLHFARYGRGVFVSTEMPPDLVLHACVSDRTGISFRDIRAGRVEPHRLDEVRQAYAQIADLWKQVIVVDGISPRLDKIAATVAQLQAEAGCDWVIVDSGSKLAMGAPGAGFYDQVSFTSSELQSLALREPKTVVVASWQFNANKLNALSQYTPTLSDIKESGKVADDADIVLGLHSFDYYIERGMLSENCRPKHVPPKSVQVHVLKDRYGSDSIGRFASYRRVIGQGIAEV